MALPQTYMTQFAEKGLSVIVDETLYKGRVVLPHEEPQNWVQIGSVTYALEEGPHQRQFESMYRRHFNENINAWQKQYMKSREYKSITTIDLHTEEQEILLLEFFVHKVFPYFFDSKESLLDDLGLDGTKDSPQTVEDVAIEEYRNASDDAILDLLSLAPGTSEKKSIKEAIEKIESSRRAYTHGLDSRHILVIDGNVAPLYNEFDKATTTVHINGTTYGANKFIGSINMLERSAMKALQTTLKEETVKNEPRVIQLIDRRKVINELLARSDYMGAGLELRKRNTSTYMLVQKFPEFILENKGDYYPFPAGEIGINVTIHQGVVQQPNPPIVLGKYNHPFLPNNSRTDKSLCIAGRKYDFPGQPEKTIRAYMDDAYNVILSAYDFSTHQEFNPYWHLTRSNHKTISKDEVKKMQKQGVRITNR